MRPFIQRFIKHQGGVALIEMAIILPVLLVLVLGATEVTRFVVANMRLQKSVYVITDIVAQSSPATWERNEGELTMAKIQSALAQFRRTMGGAAGNRVMIVTSVQRVGLGDTLVRWQQSGGGSRSSGVTSVVTQAGPCGGCADIAMQPVNMSAGYDISGMRADENMIVGEGYYYYTPMMNPLLSAFGLDFPPRLLHRVMFMHPRGGDLVCLPMDAEDMESDFVYEECIPLPCEDSCGDAREHEETWCSTVEGITTQRQCINGAVRVGPGSCPAGARLWCEPPPIDGECPYTPSGAYLCQAGTAINRRQTGTLYEWECEGSNGGGDSGMCAFNDDGGGGGGDDGCSGGGCS